MGDGGSPLAATVTKRKRTNLLSRDAVIRRLSSRQRDTNDQSPLVVLKEIFEETPDKGRFVGDTLFWKYFEDIDIQRIYHTQSVEFRNLRLMFYETCFYCALLVVVTTYAYTLQSRSVYDARQQQSDYWSGCDAQGSCSINGVEDVNSFWNWMQGEFLERAFTDYGQAAPPRVANISVPFAHNDFPVTYTPRFVGPSAGSVLLGTIRLRQLRVQQNQGCKVSQLFSHIYPDCYGSYEDQAQSKHSYKPRFAPTYLSSAFNWRSATETRAVWTMGHMGSYSGDGFVLELPNNHSDALVAVNDLWQWHWVDRATRAVVIELSTLNINLNVIVSNRIVFEFGATGSTVGTIRSLAARVLHFSPSPDAGAGAFALQLIVLLAFMLYTGLVLWLMYKTCRGFLGERPLTKMRRSGVTKSCTFLLHTLYHYFRYGWNCVDLALLLLFYTHAGYRIATYVAKGREPALAPEIIGHPELHMPFSRIMQPVIGSNVTLALLAMLSWVKLFKYLCMSVYFRLLVRLLERCVAKLAVFSMLLLVIFFGFAIAFFIGLGSNEEEFTSVTDSFLVLFFMLIDGFSLDARWFDPGREQLIPFVFFCYITLIYFVLLNIFVAVVLDVYATTSKHLFRTETNNPMAVFIKTYYNWMKGISLVQDTTDHNLKKEDLSIRLELLPGIVRRKWVEKKRKMQQVASANFEGMELFPGEGNLNEHEGRRITDWMLPSTRVDVMERMQNTGEPAPVPVYEIPPVMLKSDISCDQLQRLMDEDNTLPILLGCQRAVDVIRRFREGGRAAAEAADPLRRLQGFVFSRVDELERVRLDEDLPEVPQINRLTEEMSGAITDVRNQFRMELAGIIEATGSLFEHLVELTQGLNAVRQNHQDVLGLIRQKVADKAERRG